MNVRAEDMTQNKYGLDRYIDADTKRAIRQRCGFGCVICGCGIVQYHHFAPPFADAVRHDPAGITLLCVKCHDLTHRGIITDQFVANKNALPQCVQAGHTGDFLFLCNGQVPVRFGSSRVRASTILMHDDQVVFGFSAPEQPGSPVQLNAILTDDRGNELLRIINNEWQVGIGRYDISVTADTLKVNTSPSDTILEMSLAAGREIWIRKLNMHYRGFSVLANEDSFTFRIPGGGSFSHNGEILADVGIWMKSAGALVGVNSTGGAAIAYGRV